MDKNLYVYDSGNNKHVRLTGNENGHMEVDASGTIVGVQSNNKNLVAEDTVTGMRDSVTTEIYDGPVYADIETATTGVDCKGYTMVALYMTPNNVTGTCHLQYSPNENEFGAEWFNIHEEVFSSDSDNRVTIRNICASMVRFQIDNNADNAGGIEAWITLSRT